MNFEELRRLAANQGLLGGALGASSFLNQQMSIFNQQLANANMFQQNMANLLVPPKKTFIQSMWDEIREWHGELVFE